MAQLIDKRYGNAWRETIPLRRATPSGSLRRPSVFSQLDSYARSHPQPKSLAEPDHTTHYSVVDAEGNAVSVTTTLNDGFGSRVTAEGLGFLLNDEMDDFSSKPGAPNMYGLLQGPANAIGPGKRPLSAMTPTIVLKNGKLFLVLGSPGGPTIITTVANVLMGVVDYGLNIQQAVNARALPRSMDARPDHGGSRRAFRPIQSVFWSTWDIRSKLPTVTGAMPSALPSMRKPASCWEQATDVMTVRRLASDA